MTAVIIINYHGLADTLECLESLRDAVQAPHPFKVWVLDNNSGDESPDKIRAAYPWVNVIESSENLGFTGGNNFAIECARSDAVQYFLLLNNDTVIERSALQELLLAAYRLPEFGLLTPAIRYYDRKEEHWFAGSRIDLSRGVAVHDNSRPPNQNDPPRVIPWASGCAMLIRREVLDQVGSFDNRYFLNWEDVDLSLRITDAGWKIGLVPSAVIYHKVGRSFATTWGTGTYYYVRNHLLLVYLHAPRKYRAYLHVIGGHLRQALRAIRRNEPKSARAAFLVARAVWDFALGKFGPGYRVSAGRR